MKLRNRPILNLTLIGCLLWMQLAVACASHRYVPGQRIESREQARLETYLERRYPATLKAVQRLSVTVRRSRHDFLGYLLMRQPNAFRATAMGEMGGRVFDFFAGDDGTLKILKKPRLVPSRPLSDGVMGDILHVYASGLKGEKYVTEAPNGELTLVIRRDANKVAEFIFDPRERKLIRSLEAENGQVIREAWYSDHRKVKGWRRAIPAHIRLNNYRWHYTLEVQILEIAPLPANAEIPSH